MTGIPLTSTKVAVEAKGDEIRLTSDRKNYYVVLELIDQEKKIINEPVGGTQSRLSTSWFLEYPSAITLSPTPVFNILKFHRPTSPWVLLISHVGSTGLDLTLTGVIVILDQPWYTQDERQIRSRAHRQPQKNIVATLLASGTSDLMVAERIKF
ncbi:hypothetical protein D9758_018080 [Tetrapyrgos nigripes]|uniref:Helicase C-terminal domain-containing protein n=1 Tax=Tetrapyrgos nigripes TaxID=182062 RepID=A0A8H5BBV4_9AGAR|nr:hypothetical protein D9758_018080 [Tetrapyrgos nigripes]